MSQEPAESGQPALDTVEEAAEARGPGADGQAGQGVAALTLGSIGVVYGDIGTSPLYALREGLRYAARDGLLPSEVIGVVSLLLWALIVIVTGKYVLFLLRADNHGEGGTLSLLALTQSALGRRTAVLLLLGIAGAALFYGDAAITPAISVLSAVEGLGLVTPDLAPYVLPLAVAILVALFAVQHRGTGAIARWFGPITALWFLVMAVAGARQIVGQPAILAALDPLEALRFLAGHGTVSLLVLGATFLAVTGAEALYADLGHFGRRPIRIAWLGLVFPSLAVNYLGQDALVLQRPEAFTDPFFLLVPGWALLPLVLLATVATVIASQAVITGTYSLTQQAIQLGLLPRLVIRHTSETRTGQIYLPLVNWLLLAAVLLLVLLFESSDALASAYGIAVTGTMIVTSLLAFLFVRHGWGWPLAGALAAVAPLLGVELAFLAANLLKLPEGGYVPILIAALLGVVMWTWTRGAAILFDKTRASLVPLEGFVESLGGSRAALVPGTAVFLTGDPLTAPGALLHNLKHNHALHRRNIVLTVRTAETPRVPDDERVSVERLGDRFLRVELRFGYMETPEVPKALRQCRRHGLAFDMMSTSFFLGRRKLRPDPRSGLPAWQDKLFIALAEVAADPTDFYALPPNRVVELGSQIAI
ncbi:KUP system potassium uptake protein [Tistlia consotensis]|uniref:Probable potassium transport system protein Kup n=1 Tax=Tistlia consotensis USBA 355 TaxID=560819 RepID=A0A1Y6BYB5_9PROT|nr:potassium transporter Kup [Tistlia consotensis]SMF36088.1 KUP system potassium uptake protein [Tistlia consotensis USBA 355]SNR71400.1 KUP system potassium uptake protein [Tistlia consotensis]